MNTRFVPPLLEVRASDYLRGLVNGLLEILSAKSTQLAGGRRRKPEPGGLHRSGYRKLLAALTVNSHIPVLSHLLQGQRCHPEELFSALTALGASLTTFSTTFGRATCRCTTI